MFRKSVWIPILIVLLAVMGCGLFYSSRVSKQEPVKIYNPIEVEPPATPKPPPPGETAESGHWHGDEWHAEPHGSPVEVQPQKPEISAGEAQAPTTTQPTPPPAVSQTPLPAPERDPEFVNPTSRSSNPLFADGVPEHLQCPPEFIGVYLNEDKENIIRKVMPIYEEIMEKWNPNRPIADLWDPMVTADKWYRENADPEKAEMLVGGGRLDWLVQQYLDFPEIVVLLGEDAPRASDMLRVEIGLFSPDWNAFTLPEGRGRTFRTDLDKKYVFTWSGRTQTLEDGTTITPKGPWTYTTGPTNGDPNAEVIHINLDEISDEELESLGGWNYNINPYTTGTYKLGDSR